MVKFFARLLLTLFDPCYIVIIEEKTIERRGNMKKLLKVLLIIILILALVAVGAGVYIVNKIKKLNYLPIQPHEIEVTEWIE